MKVSIKTFFIFTLFVMLFLAGCSGSNGKTGPQGPAGTNGINGSNGTNGSNGQQGPAGPTMPVIQSLSVVGLPAIPGSNVTTTVIAQSAQDLALTYTWTVSNGWTIVSGNNGPTAIITAPSSYSITGTATIEVSDTQGRSAMGMIVLSTESSGMPVINTISVAPNPAIPGASMLTSVNASDPNGNTLSYIWTASPGWAVTGYGTTATVVAPSTYNTGGYITVTVSNGNGWNTTGSVAVSTIADQYPVINSITATPNPVSPNGIMTAVISAYDPDGNTLNYTWASSSGWTIIGYGTTATVVAPSTYSTSGSITVTVSDNYGYAVTGTIAASTVANTPPVISSIAASPNPVSPNGTITALVNASDPNGNILNYSWTASPGWTVTGYGTTATVVAPSTYSTGGYITVTVSDDYGYAVTGTIAASTVANTPPVISSIAAIPNPVAINGTMAISVSATDTDGDHLGYTWIVPNGWTISGGQGTSQISVTAPNSYANSGKVYVTVSDGNGGVVSGSLGISTEGNTSPVISSIAASPNPVSPNGTITALVNASDPNGNILNYLWTASPGWSIIGYGTTATVVAPSTYNTGGYVTVTVSDHYGYAVTGTIGVSTLDVIPSTPTNLTALSRSSSILLTWNASTGATSYTIYESAVSGGPYTAVGTTTTTVYTVTGITNSTPYYFVVTAQNNAAESGYSNQVKGSKLVTSTYAVGTNPFGIAIDASGNVWVANYGSTNVTELSSAGATLGTYAVGTYPYGIAIDASGNVWVTNEGSNNVTELSPAGVPKGTYNVGTNPDGIAIDASGNVWVANYDSNNVTELSPTGATKGTYNVGTSPWGIAIDASGNVWVTNYGSKYVTELMGITTGPQYFPYTGPQFPGGGNL